VSAAAVPTLPWDTPASMRRAVRCQYVGPTIPDSRDAVTNDAADQGSVAVLTMYAVNGDRGRDNLTAPF
jgi:hypothetical protein